MIYCLEDDDSIRNVILYTLNAAGFSAAGFAESGAFWEALAQQKPDLVLLDIMLPGEDGISVLKKLRARSSTAEIPVIMATAKGEEYDRVLGLDLGADDYLSKPFGMLEMVSRIRAVLRRTGPRSGESSPVLRMGALELDTRQHTVTAGGEPVQLTRKEYDLLRLFLEQPGKAFSREELLSRVWSSDFMGETRTVDVHIRTLRSKLGSCGDCIRTVRGVGYRMEAEET